MLTGGIDEQGYFYKHFERVGDIYNAQFYLPNEKLIIEYNEPSNYLKTDNPNEDKVLAQQFFMREKILVSRP